MKYYAVTDDPRELYHYGVKGMKWGQHIFGDKPKSPGYHKATRKLKALSASKAPKQSKVITKQQKIAQKEARKRDKEAMRFQKATEKAQRKISAIESLYDFDRENSYRKSLAREQKVAKINEQLFNANADRNLRALQKSVKSEKKLDKYMQQAREGTLRYGKLSEDQIHKLQDRLNLEAQTRKLGGMEKQSWHAQKKEARRAGKLQGIQKGTAAIMEEVARGAAQFGVQGVTNRLLMKSAAKHEGQYQKAKDKARNKRSEREIRKDIKRDLHEEVVRDKILNPGDYDRTVKQRLTGRVTNTFKSQARIDAEQRKLIKDREERKRIEDNYKKVNDDLYKKLVLGDKQNRPIADPEERKRIYDEIYGINNTSNKSGKHIETKPTEKIIKIGEEDIFGTVRNERLSNTIRDNALGVINRISDKPLSAIEKSMRRNAKKNKKRNEAKMRKGQYVHTDDDIWLD